MILPVWILWTVAALLFIFGAYRLRLGFRSAEAQAQAAARGGLFGLPRRTHALVGIVYMMLAAALVATSFGWRPFVLG